MFDVGDLSVLTFGNCVLKTGVIKWPPKLYVVGLRFSTFLTFFCKIQKYMIFLRFFELLHTFSRTLCPTSLPHTLSVVKMRPLRFQLAALK